MATSALTGSRPLRAGAAAAAAAVVLVAFQAVRVHQSTGEWRLTPTEAPPKLTEFDRRYRRSEVGLAMRAPHGIRPAGTTAGGGDLFAPRLDAFQVRAHVVPTVIWVRDEDGKVWTYGLVGGP